MNLHPSGLFFCLFLSFSALPTAAQTETDNLETAGAAQEQQADISYPDWYEKMPEEQRKNLKKLVDTYCPMFERSGTSIREATDADMVDCSYVHARSPDKEIKSRCYTKTYTDFTQKPPAKKTRFYTLIKDGGGTCRSASAVELSQQNRGEPLYKDIVNAHHLYHWGNDDVILGNFGKNLLVSDSARKSLRTINDDGIYVLCGIESQLQGWKITGRSRGAVCEKFANDDFSYPEGTKPESLTHERELYGAPLPAETHITNQTDVDIDRDGKAEKLLTLYYSSGAGCGCEFKYLSLPQQPENIALNEKLKSLAVERDCKGSADWSVIDIDGQAYIAQNAKKMAPQNAGRIVRDETKPRVLYAYKNGEFTEICRAKPLTRRILDHKVLSPEKLMYQPIP
ncbi:MAG TPA: hypothetical protein PLX33_08735 [Alphaproteobacteria bacterium]|nr:hypothetical protein [Alphaproteobacteria bacterium]